NTNHYLVGCDGGVYESWDRGANWDFKRNLPVTQFHDVTTDNSAPFYYVYGGAQDNFNVGGPARTRNANGIVNSDWFVTLGFDRFLWQRIGAVGIAAEGRSHLRRHGRRSRECHRRQRQELAAHRDLPRHPRTGLREPPRRVEP